jgi:steroid delta-isomerase-like uncharacterized protein
MTSVADFAAINRRVVERFLAGTHSRNIEDVAVIDATVAPDIVCHGFPGGDPTDHASYKNFFRGFRVAFDDMDFDVNAIVADDHFVAVRWTIHATRVGEFAGVPADGRRIVFDGMVLYRMQAGLIAETWLRIDEVGLLRQVGALAA